MTKYTNALRRLYVGSGVMAGSCVTWLASELNTGRPASFYVLIVLSVGIVTMALVDSWRLR